MRPWNASAECSETYEPRRRALATTNSHLTFQVDLAIISGASVNNVTVSHNRFLHANQAVTNWGGSGWDISHNEIVDLQTDCGGGIGIFIGDWQATPSGVVDNLVAHNRISGTLHVAPGVRDAYDFRLGDLVVRAAGCADLLAALG
jgi:hypothetical protein